MLGKNPSWHALQESRYSGPEQVPAARRQDQLVPALRLQCYGPTMRTLVATLTALMLFAMTPVVAGDYEVTHLKLNRVFEGTTLLADMSDSKSPRVVEVDFKGNILWEFSPPDHLDGAVLDAAKLVSGNILITIQGSGIYEINRNFFMFGRL